MTDDISTKDMQIDLMRDVNRKIAGELQEARKGAGVRKDSDTVGTVEEDEDDDTDTVASKEEKG